MQASSDSLISSFFFKVFPYLTLIIFFGGLAYRVITWLRIPRPQAHQALFPKPEGSRIIPSMIADEVIFPRLRFSSKSLWGLAVLLHIGLIFTFFGHIRLFFEPTVIWNLLNLDEQGVHTLAYVMGGLTGIVFLIGLVGLLLRRLNGPMRTISIPIDYLTLGWIIAIVVTGDYMRFALDLNVANLQVYFSSLLKFQPTIVPIILTPAFVIHYFTVQAFLIYFPFSKLVHVIGSVFTNYLIKR